TRLKSTTVTSRTSTTTRGRSEPCGSCPPGRRIFARPPQDRIDGVATGVTASRATRAGRDGSVAARVDSRRNDAVLPDGMRSAEVCPHRGQYRAVEAVTSPEDLDVGDSERQAIGAVYRRPTKCEELAELVKVGTLRLPPHSDWTGDTTDWQADPHR